MGIFFLIMSTIFGSHSHAAEQKGKCNLKEERAFGKFPATVVKLADGDTIDVKTTDNKIRRIRLLHIDTPETKFQGKSQGKAGELAAQRLSELLPLRSEVTIHFEEKPCDLYGRYLGIVMKEDSNVNLTLVNEGYAVSLCFAPNLAGCEKFIQAAKEALENPNVFATHSALIPHEFRFAESNRPEAPFVADYLTKKVYPFEKWKSIEPLNRVFFSREQDIQRPYRLAD